MRQSMCFSASRTCARASSESVPQLAKRISVLLRASLRDPDGLSEVDQFAHELLDLVSDVTIAGVIELLGIGEIPIDPMIRWKVRASVAAAHGHHVVPTLVGKAVEALGLL